MVTLYAPKKWEYIMSSNMHMLQHGNFRKYDSCPVTTKRKLTIEKRL